MDVKNYDNDDHQNLQRREKIVMFKVQLRVTNKAVGEMSKTRK